MSWNVLRNCTDTIIQFNSFTHGSKNVGVLCGISFPGLSLAFEMSDKHNTFPISQNIKKIIIGSNLNTLHLNTYIEHLIRYILLVWECYTRIFKLTL